MRNTVHLFMMSVRLGVRWPGVRLFEMSQDQVCDSSADGTIPGVALRGGKSDDFKALKASSTTNDARRGGGMGSGLE